MKIESEQISGKELANRRRKENNMLKLVFKIASDWEEVVRLVMRLQLKQELKGMDSTQSPAAFKPFNIIPNYSLLRNE